MRALVDLAVFSLAAAALLVAAAGVKVAIDSRAHFRAGEALAGRGERRHVAADLVAAGEAHARAVRSYVPFFSHGRESLARIRDLGLGLQRDGHLVEARRVWLAGADAASSLTLLYAPYEEEAASLVLAARVLAGAEAHRE